MAFEFDAKGVLRKVLHLKNTNLPQFDFEWHPESENVYVVHGKNTKTPTGEIIASGIQDHGTAWNVVLIWSRGYHTRAREEAIAGQGQEPTRDVIESENRVKYGKPDKYGRQWNA